jgi:hypothetical protein
MPYSWILREIVARDIPRDSAAFDFITLVVQQALDDGIALHRLQRAEQPAAHRPALRRQVVRLDRPV